MKKLLIMIAVALGLGLFSTVRAGKDYKVGANLKLKKGSTVSADAGWLTDFAKAKAEAKMGKKMILADFSGSDWCGYCIRLDKNVFSKAEFKKFAKDNLVLLLIDFPQNKKNQSADLQKRNIALAEKYSVRGFPTVLLLDYNGKVIAQTGYREGGPTDYIEHLKELMKKK